ncbi:M20 metallopeptidase family protein [Novosphingobium mangrovi (ex Hu et al. 2023)]|uniref:M20 family metallopeptidase n=1 Tax=Novosphingobium mangrovi (ex Hu et al. 2023) TaxID=2930094 RepID=A0ABT0AGF9_9SPHN|nr:M20 family metallopeptidase [Novosphingobium mangrovi (ex Hu et al. 2023)]MCJ1962267.1 M20 family metallopeptidase [Novosphingobium mangrovi (ex Hu et al. 2023)]
MSVSIEADCPAAISERIVALRRAIHAEPELGLHTPLTRDKIRAELADLPLEWEEGPSTTGLVATLQGGAGPGRSVLLRGDMDALAMPEETGLDFASTIPGVMHACGHDTHVAMLAGAARLLAGKADRLTGEVRFMFQPGEEGWHGARYMLDDGLLGGPGTSRALPEAAFALHIMPNARHGMIGGRAGPLMASADQLAITVKGRGGHASMPHDTMDPMPIACEIVAAIQTMVARRFSVFDPVVVTISKITAGSAHNVIPDHVDMLGTMRSLSATNRARLREEVTALAAGIAGAHGLAAEVEIIEGFPVTVCDARAVDFGEGVARDLFGADTFERLTNPIMGAEDFAYVLEKTPGAMFFLGVAAEGDDWSQCCGIHSTRMMVDESVLPRGALFLAGLAERYLATGWA